MPKCMCQSVCLYDCATVLVVHSSSAREWPFQSLAKCHFITNLKKEKMMLNRLVQIQVNHLSEDITPAPRPSQCHMLSTGLLLCLPPDRAAFHIPTGASTDLPHAHNRLHCPRNAHSPPPRWDGVSPMTVPTPAVPHTWPKQIFERFMFSRIGRHDPSAQLHLPASPACFLACSLPFLPSLLPVKGYAERLGHVFKAHLLV